MGKIDVKRKDLVIIRKTTKVYEIQFKKNGVRENIKGWTIYFTVKESKKDTDVKAKINKKITNHVNASAGKTLIQLSTSDTDLPAGSYHYSIDYKDDEGNEDVILHGRIKFEESTRQTRD